MRAFPYDVGYTPALPICDVVLFAAGTDSRARLSAIIDTGADSTIVPTQHLLQIGARPAFETGLRSQWGERRTVFLYLVDVQVADLTLPGIYVVGDDLGSEVVLGRNVINRLRILLDGPAALTKILRVEA